MPSNKRLQLDNLRAVKIAMLAGSHCMAILPSHKLRLKRALNSQSKKHQACSSLASLRSNQNVTSLLMGFVEFYM